ncbi:NAD(+) diphosphatase [Proteobacteria bacterium 005FR1]|nr:NAD(+) diphosphatase [Proteobacteria bacterium 005FR1]
MDSFTPGFQPPESAEDARYIVLAGDQLLVGDQIPWEPLEKSTWRFADLVPEEQHYLGLYRGAPCYGVKVAADAAPPPGCHWQSLRSLIASSALGASEFSAVSCALQVFNWDRGHQYCGQCGSPTVAHSGERARVCEQCAINYYPRISPCVIMLITRGDECLLARHAQYRSNFYSALAGFIEPGESVENALHREVAEEVSLRVKNLSYFGSQPWPFPGQLMLGFHAEYDSGEIAIDDMEIEDARWWSYRDLPMVPPAGTLSGMLIRHFVDSRSG